MSLRIEKLSINGKSSTAVRGKINKWWRQYRNAPSLNSKCSTACIQQYNTLVSTMNCEMDTFVKAEKTEFDKKAQDVTRVVSVLLFKCINKYSLHYVNVIFMDFV